MKKTVLSSFLLIGFSLALTGCGSQVNNPADNSSSTSQSNKAPQAGSGRANRNMPDFGQPKSEPDVRGIIKTITGNEVVVLKIDIQRRNATSTDAAGAASRTGTARASISLSGGMPAGGPTGMGGRPGGEGVSETDRAEMLKKLKEMSTGEEKVVIPVGIKMLKSSSSNGKREMVEATLADLAADKNITIWMNKSVTDRKVAEFVLIN
jgi:hypothetical protein